MPGSSNFITSEALYRAVSHGLPLDVFSYGVTALMVFAFIANYELYSTV